MEALHGAQIATVKLLFQVSVGEIMAANSLSPADVTKLREGTRLFVPGVEDSGGGRMRRSASLASSRARGTGITRTLPSRSGRMPSPLHCLRNLSGKCW